MQKSRSKEPTGIHKLDDLEELVRARLESDHENVFVRPWLSVESLTLFPVFELLAPVRMGCNASRESGRGDTCIGSKPKHDLISGFYGFPRLANLPTGRQRSVLAYSSITPQENELTLSSFTCGF